MGPQVQIPSSLFQKPHLHPSGGQPDANTTELCCLGQFIVYCAVLGSSLFQTRSSLKIYLHTLYIHPPSTFPLPSYHPPTNPPRPGRVVRGEVGEPRAWPRCQRLSRRPHLGVSRSGFGGPHSLGLGGPATGELVPAAPSLGPRRPLDSRLALSRSPPGPSSTQASGRASGRPGWLPRAVPAAAPDCGRSLAAKLHDPGRVPPDGAGA